MSYTSTHLTRLAGFGLAALLSAALSWSANAAEVWKVNVAKSKFSAGANTLVVNRYNGAASAHAADTKGNSAASTFLVISGGKVFLAVDETAATSGAGIKQVDYGRWMDMKLVQIGDHLRVANTYCNFRCQSGLPDSRMTLSFLATGGDPTEKMHDIVVFNAR